MLLSVQAIDDRKEHSFALTLLIFGSWVNFLLYIWKSTTLRCTNPVTRSCRPIESSLSRTRGQQFELTGKRVRINRRAPFQWALWALEMEKEHKCQLAPFNSSETSHAGRRKGASLLCRYCGPSNGPALIARLPVLGLTFHGNDIRVSSQFRVIPAYFLPMRTSNVLGTQKRTMGGG